MLTLYTTYDDIRAALGVSDEELEDATLALRLYADHLDADLDDISYDLRSTFQTTLQKTVKTDIENRFLQATRMFAVYSVSKALTTSLPMFSPKSVEDGKARVDRFNDPYKKTITEVGAQYERWRNRLLLAYQELGQVGATKTTRSYMSVVTPSSDPITGT